MPVARRVVGQARMRLGFWPRLAIAASLVTVVIYAPYRVHADRKQGEGMANFFYQACTHTADLGNREPAAVRATMEAYEKCSARLEADYTRAVPDRNDWLYAAWVGLFYALCGTFVAWALTSLGQWVWRGRAKIAEPKPAPEKPE